MKKTLLTLVLLVMAMTVGAQSVKVDYHKGDVRKYTTNVSLSMGIPMQGEQKCGLTAATTYTVDEAGADGYVVELKADDYSTTGNADLLSMVGGQFFETLKSTPAKLKLDKKGAITGLANEDAFIAAISSTVVEGINKMYADRPGLESQMPKAKLLMAANSQLTPEFVLNFFKNFTVFSLNGRDLANVKNADETIYDFFKVKSSYDVSSVNGTTTITRTAVSNMTDDDLKRNSEKADVASRTGCRRYSVGADLGAAKGYGHDIMHHRPE